MLALRDVQISVVIERQPSGIAKAGGKDRERLQRAIVLERGLQDHPFQRLPVFVRVVLVVLVIGLPRLSRVIFFLVLVRVRLRAWLELLGREE